MVHVLITSVLCGLLTQAPRAPAPRQAWVAADGLIVLEEPDDAAYATTRLKRGDRVVVLREEPVGWLAIEPPRGAFSWIERDAIEREGDERALVKVRAAAARMGSDLARLPGGTWTVLRRGDAVRLLDRPPLVLRQPDGERRIWYAIEPPEGEIRYVRADGVDDVDPGRFPDTGPDDEDFPLFQLAPDSDAAAEGRRSLLASQRLGPIDPAFAAVGPRAADGPLSPRFASDLARAEAGHRAVLVLPMESWRFDQIRRDYRALLAAAATPQERSAVQSRLDQVDRQEAVSRAARELAAIADRSRRRDGELRTIQERLTSIDRRATPPFEAEGMLQRSSRMVEGRRVYALFDDEGQLGAYLRIPPGLDAEKFVGRRVGVRGESRYNESLRSRIIWARDLEAIDGSQEKTPRPAKDADTKRPGSDSFLDFQP